MIHNKAILEMAGQHLGVEEIPGAAHNPVIVGYAHSIGHGWVEDDETPWCASLVGHILGSLGIQHSGGLNAKSYLDWGLPVATPAAEPGDIVVLSRGDPNGPYGHVAIFVRWSGDNPVLRGGNQNNKVTDQVYPRHRVLAVRRAPNTENTTGRGTVHHGQRGPLVAEVQRTLQGLGYQIGNVDGVFGNATRRAVLAFQAEHELTTDGVVGPATWQKLLSAETPMQVSKSREELDAKDLADRGSETASAGLKGRTTIGATIGGYTVVELWEPIKEFVAGKDQFLTVFDVIEEHWPMLIAIAGLCVGLYYINKMLEARVKDARTGANMRR